MRKTVFFLSALILSCVFLATAASETTLIDFSVNTPNINLHKAESTAQCAAYTAVGDDQKCLRLEWDSGKARHFEFWIGQRINLSEFTKARIIVKAYIPDGSPLSKLNLRISDKDMETFQFHAVIPEDASGWQNIVYEIDKENPKAGIWGGSGNKKLDSPLRLGGFAGEFRDNSGTGWAAIAQVSIIILDKPLEVTLNTGNPIHVLRPSDNRVPVLEWINSKSGKNSGVLKYRISGTNDQRETAGELKWTAESAEMIRLELPRPSELGVYYIDTVLIEDDPGVVTEKRFSYAYMTPAGPTPGRAKGFLFGICSNSQHNAVDTHTLEAMAASWCGAKIIREDIGWDNMQPSESRWDFTTFDRSVDIFGKYNLEVQAVYCYVPRWAVAKDWKPAAPDRKGNGRPDYRHWANFIRAFAERYQDKIRYVEVWNEPDLAGFANFTQPEYLELLKIAYRETKAVSSDMTVLTGGFTCMPGMSTSMIDPDHMPKTLRDAKGFYDVHAFHGHGPLFHYQNQIERMVKMRKSLGVTAPWYANETAISSVHIGEREQARILFQKFLYSWARGSIGYNWYNLRNDGYDPLNHEHNMGLLTNDFYPKAAYATYNMLANVFQDGTYIKDLSPDNIVDGYLFKDKHGNYLFPNWNKQKTSAPRLMIMTHAAGQVEQIDLFGNASALPSDNGHSIVQVTSEPMTIRFVNSSTEPAIAGDLFYQTEEINIFPGGKADAKFSLYNPTRQTRSFQLRFTAPNGLSLDKNTLFTSIAPGKKEVLTLKLHASDSFRSLYGKQEKVSMRMRVDRLQEFALEFPVWTVTNLSEGDFPARPDFELNDISQVFSLIPNDPAREHLFWKGPEDLEGKIFLAKKDGHLNMRIEVTDNKHFQPYSGGNVWEGDNIQMALAIPGQSGFWEIGLTHKDNGGSEAFIWLAPTGFDAGKAVGRIQLQTSRDDAKKLTVYEASIPFAAIGLTDRIGKQGFRFNLLINDNDGEVRAKFISIAPGIGETKNSDFFPVVSF